MDKQRELFRNLKKIKDYWVRESVNSILPQSDLFWTDCEDQYRLLQSKFISEEDRNAFEQVINELAKGVIHSILVMIDGGDSLADKFKVDLIEQETKTSLKKGSALHEEFVGYLIDAEM